ncbi:discoidin domain-containing protein [Pontiella agarivorans]|uniref:Discoidin domain-containing protein n=1 Tax=Pontiella agarivorans TaxID=3038953 RepID=A0ABU5MY25_9BACT|nr:discoidin domain-containing protein [Pontiella agarivorans]MDZ8119097.1 discoidin domain-containing protein [Pontiella agarivorans]
MNKEIIVLLSALLATNVLAQENRLTVEQARASQTYRKYAASFACDGKISNESRWIGSKDHDGAIWLELKLAQVQQISGVHLYSGYGNKDAITDFHFEFKNGVGEWIVVPSSVITGNRSTALSLPFDSTLDVKTDTLRLVVTKTKMDLARIKEIVLWPETGQALPPLEKPVAVAEKSQKPAVEAPLVYLNQSGFNLNKPKRFTAPTVEDGTPFNLVNKRTHESVFSGTVLNHIGDFSAFNPDSQDEFIVKIGPHTSFPFRIGHWWLEKVTYQNAVTFMDQSRHYFGNYKKKCRGSFGWRDDHHFGWELNTLVPQYLSNPSAYERMPNTIEYEQLDGFNGVLEPFNENAPDIVKLIHFGADVIVTQKADHAFLKEQLAYFVYAWPALKQWLPEQNYRVIRDYVFNVWGKESVGFEYPYDLVKDHNLFETKTLIGTNKGELPPGHSVLPNLLMYEVAKRENCTDAQRYFEAAYNQVEWMIQHLDWNDPLTTKGQRMSEHITMTGLGLMLSKYANRAPEGLADKIEAWKTVAIARSANMWDFRKVSDTQWCLTGPKKTMWNEPGNLLGFPSCVLAALSATPDSEQNERLREISKSQMDNAFGRNPTGRHFSYDAPREIEGCELGWYSYHRGGIGQLANTPFVFDGAPKNEHYPYNPDAGNVGWTEGWVQFNVAFNLSLAYMAYDDTELKVDKQSRTIRLKAPLNFDYDTAEKATVQVVRNGVVENLELIEEGENAAWLSVSGVDLNDVTEVSYGYGYFKHAVRL